MTLKIKESDWITIDLYNPKTLPKENVNVMVRLDLTNRSKYSHTNQPEIWFPYKYFEGDELVWYMSSRIVQDDSLCNWIEDIHSGDKYALIDWDKLSDQWITIDIQNKATFPNMDAIYLIDNGKISVVRIVFIDETDYKNPKDTLYHIFCNTLKETYLYDIYLKTGDKYIPLELEGYNGNK
jgi:hypothetical protein